jgi:hypothetical protein
MGSYGEEAGKGDEIEDALASLGIEPPFFWENACSKVEMLSIAWSAEDAFSEVMEIAVGLRDTPFGPSKDFRKWLSDPMTLAVLKARAGKHAFEVPGLFEAMMAGNGEDMIRQIRTARKEGWRGMFDLWKLGLPAGWCIPEKSKGLDTPLPPLRRVSLPDALSWPLCFWSDSAIVALVEERFPEAFPAEKISVRRVQKFRRSYRLKRSPRTVVQYDGVHGQFFLGYRSLPSNGA